MRFKVVFIKKNDEIKINKFKKCRESHLSISQENENSLKTAAFFTDINFNRIDILH